MKCRYQRCDNDRDDNQEFCSLKCSNAFKLWITTEMKKGGDAKTNKPFKRQYA